MDCNCCSLENKICFICDNEYMCFFNKPNVVGVALGYKIKNGFNTFKKCITIFVSKKIPSNCLNQNQLIPSHYKNIKTDVIESGFFYPKSLTDRIRPVEGGYIIGPRLSLSQGTMGCLVSDRNNLYILSNNHIIADENYLPIGREILQPSIFRGGKVDTDTIATLAKFIPLKPKNFLYYPTNYADCAIAKVTDPSLVTSSIAFVGKPKGITDAVLDQPIKKVGCTTELTTGKVTNINATIKINFGIGRCLFKKQIICNCVAKGGDSGSIVLDDNNYVIGLLMSGNATIVDINPIKYILTSLKVNLVTN